MKTQVLKNGTKIIIFLLIFMLMFSILNRFFNPSGTMKEWFQSNAMLEFYRERKESIDVIYVGNSCIYSAVSPMEIYEKIGITGYSISSPKQKIWSSYYMIKEVLKYQKPKLIFIEVGEVFYGKNTNDELSTRKAIDTLKLSKNKIDMVNDNDYNMSNFEKLGCIFPIIRYHSRWSSVDEYDFRKFIFDGNYTEKGFLLEKEKRSYKGRFSNKIQNEIIEDYNLEEELDKIPNECEKKVDEIINLCKENNIELVLIKFPEPKVWNEEKHNIIKEFAYQKEIKFVDLNYEEKINIDWETDTQDGGDHLNIYGAEKVAQYLADFIKNNYELQDHRNDKNYADWNEDLKKYKIYKNRR